MAHILLGRKLEEDGALRDKLRSWGVTSSSYSLSSGGNSWPDVWTCDGVLVSPEGFRALQAADSGSEVGLAAPVLIWDGQTVSAPDAPVPIPLPAIVANRDLYAALQICLAHAGYLRDTQGTLPILEENPQQVMGHELLTPLAAIKAALEVLEQDTMFTEGDQEQQILALAIRNVERLEAAVDWSWKLMATGNEQKVFLPSVVDQPAETGEAGSRSDKIIV